MYDNYVLLTPGKGTWHSSSNNVAYLVINIFGRNITIPHSADVKAEVTILHIVTLLFLYATGHADIWDTEV